jgi:hypothetical protein
VEILEDSSWSCIHGVERWRVNCGCNSGNHPDWNQEWRAPLRQALDWLRDTVASKYQEKALPLFADPWAARDDYIEVVLGRSPDRIAISSIPAARELNTADRSLRLLLRCSARHARSHELRLVLDELSGIGAVNASDTLAVIDLARQLFPDDVEQFVRNFRRQRATFVNRLTAPKSTASGYGRTS